MIDINELRRLVQAATPGPWHATKSVETNSWAVWSDTTRLMELRPTKTVDMYQVSNTAAFIAAANPATVIEILDRLEAAESALSNLGVTPEEAKEGLARHKATLARLEAAEKERDKYKVAYSLWREKTEWVQEGINSGAISSRYLGWHRADITSDLLKKAEKERDALRTELKETWHRAAAAHDTIKALRAKIEAMEKQEPECEVVGQVRNVLYEVRTLKYDLQAGTKLYALPGAQPELNLSDPAVQKRLAAQWGYVPAPENCPCCEEPMRVYSRCSNSDCEAVTVTPEQARHNKALAFARTVATRLDDQPAPSVPDGFVWPECPKRRQSHVLFDDGYEEGWAACISTVKAMLAAAPSVPDGWLQHAAHMATLAKKLREPDWCLESIMEMQGELRTLEEAALAAAPKPEAKL